MTTILVPLDGSELASRAVPFAAAIAERTGQSLVLLRAVSTQYARSVEAALAVTREARRVLDGVARPLAADGVGVMTTVIDAPPEQAVLETAARAEVGLVVMSTHGHGGPGRWSYGSVTDTVLHESPVPILVVPAHGLDAWPLDAPIKVMVPLDGSDLAQSAIDPACQIADTLGGSLLLTSVVTPPHQAEHADGHASVDPDPTDSALEESRRYLEGLAAGLRTATRPVEVRATHGTPYVDITEMANKLGAGLIVMATHGRSGMARTELGSVATATIRQSDVPILLVRPTESMRQVRLAASPAVGEQSEPEGAAEPSMGIGLTFSPDELDTLVRVVGDRYHDEPADPSTAAPMGRLLEKLRTARAAPVRPHQRDGHR